MSDPVPALVEELAAHYRYLHERVEAAARRLPPEKLFAKPYDYGNSVGHLVLHLTGNLNHYIGANIAGSGYVRDRPREFADDTPPPPEELMAGWQQAVELVLDTLRSQSPDDLLRPPPEGSPPFAGNRFGVFLVCASHINNHVGQMAYLLRAHGRSFDDPPLW